MSRGILEFMKKFFDCFLHNKTLETSPTEVLRLFFSFASEGAVMKTNNSPYWIAVKINQVLTALLFCFLMTDRAFP